MKNILVIAVLVICVIVLLPLCSQKPEKQRTDISTSEIKNEVKSVKELAVLEQPYKLLVKDNKENCLLENRLVGKHLCSSASFSVVCDYTMHVGFNLDKVQIIQNNEYIEIRYPQAEILSHGSKENCQEYEWENGLWSKINIDHFDKIKGKLEEEKKQYEENHKNKYNEAATAQLKNLIMKRLTHLARSHNSELIEYPEKEYLWDKMVLNPDYAVKFIQIQEE